MYVIKNECMIILIKSKNLENTLHLVTWLALWLFVSWFSVWSRSLNFFLCSSSFLSGWNHVVWVRQAGCLPSGLQASLFSVGGCPTTQSSVPIRPRVCVMVFGWERAVQNLQVCVFCLLFILSQRFKKHCHLRYLSVRVCLSGWTSQTHSCMCMRCWERSCLVTCMISWVDCWQIQRSRHHGRWVTLIRLIYELKKSLHFFKRK